MKPYYQEGGMTIYHGDCAEVLPTLPMFDLVLTDPPYGIGEHGGKCRTKGRPGHTTHEKVSGWDNARPGPDVFGLVLAAGRESVVWGGNYFADLLPPTMGWLYWRKLMGGDFSDGELAWTSRHNALREFTKCPKAPGRLHPCQKPTELMIWCINLCARDAANVLDPFMGVGSTLRAAKDLGRQATGIEREEKYCEIAANRLRQEVLF